MVLKELLDICLPKLSNSLFHKLEILNLINFVYHIELSHPLPLTCDEEDEDNSNFLSCFKIISIEVSNRICSIPHSYSYNIHSYKSRKLVDFLFMPLHARMSKLAKFFKRRFYNFNVKIVKTIQTSNEYTNFNLIYTSIMMHLIVEIISWYS